MSGSRILFISQALSPHLSFISIRLSPGGDKNGLRQSQVYILSAQQKEQEGSDSFPVVPKSLIVEFY